MNFYEITNGYIGESYVRVYVWAKDEEQAFSLAEPKFDEAGYEDTTHYLLNFYSHKTRVRLAQYLATAVSF